MATCLRPQNGQFPFLFFCLFTSHLVLVFAGIDGFPSSDEFNNSATLSSWATLSGQNGWPNRFSLLSIDSNGNGKLTLQPTSGGWYMRKVGGFVYKEMGPGDFVLSTQMHVQSVVGGGTTPPSTQYSLAGIFIRIPNTLSPDNSICIDTTRPVTQGYENYVFLSMGRATNNAWQFEVKTTLDGYSELEIETTGTQDVELQLARIGSYILLLRRLAAPASDTQWRVHRVYHRPDMEDLATIQIGFVAYTDWDYYQNMCDSEYNSVSIVPGSNSTAYPGATGTSTPDIIGEFEYARFCELLLPSPFTSATNWSSVESSGILSFLGDNVTMNCVNDGADGADGADGEDGADGGDGDGATKAYSWWFKWMW